MEQAADRQAGPFRAGFLLLDIPAFAQDVENALEGGELRYSQRQRLLKRAEHFGIRRFDANLIIAMVQGRAAESSSTDQPTSGPSGRAPVIVTFMVVQSLILAGAWWVLA